MMPVIAAGDIGGAMIKAFLPYLGIVFVAALLGLMLGSMRKAKRGQRGNGRRVAPRATTSSGGLFRRLEPAAFATRGPSKAASQSCSEMMAQPAPDPKAVCPSCAHPFRVSKTQVGLDTQCPSCRLVFTLPTLGGAPAVEKRSTPPSAELTLTLLQELEWKRFEQVTEAYFQQMGWGTQAAPIGPDGGVDIHLTRPGSQWPDAVVQCKAWLGSKVGVSLMRELFGVMADKKVAEGFFVTTAEYSSDARTFAEGKPLTLINGADFVRRVRALPPDAQAQLVATATVGDYRTPTCPSCGRKMVKIDSSKGRTVFKPFWGCPSYPRCSGKLPMRAVSALEQSQNDLMRSDLSL